MNDFSNTIPVKDRMPSTSSAVAVPLSRSFRNTNGPMRRSRYGSPYKAPHNVGARWVKKTKAAKQGKAK